MTRRHAVAISSALPCSAASVTASGVAGTSRLSNATLCCSENPVASAPSRLCCRSAVCTARRNASASLPRPQSRQGESEIEHVQMRVIRRRRLAAQFDRAREILFGVGEALERERRRAQSFEREAQPGTVLAFGLLAQRQRLIEVGDRLLVAAQAKFGVADVGQDDRARAIVGDQVKRDAIVLQRGVFVAHFLQQVRVVVGENDAVAHADIGQRAHDRFGDRIVLARRRVVAGASAGAHRATPSACAVRRC